MVDGGQMRVSSLRLPIRLNPLMEPIERTSTLIGPTRRYNVTHRTILIASIAKNRSSRRRVIAEPRHCGRAISTGMGTQLFGVTEHAVHIVSDRRTDSRHHRGDIGCPIDIARRNGSPDVLLTRRIQCEEVILRSTVLLLPHEIMDLLEIPHLLVSMLQLILIRIDLFCRK